MYHLYLHRTISSTMKMLRDPLQSFLLKILNVRLILWNAAPNTRISLPAKRMIPIYVSLKISFYMITKCFISNSAAVNEGVSMVMVSANVYFSV